MKYRLALIIAIGVAAASALLMGWKVSSADRTAYVVIVDHDVNDQMLSCGPPLITQSPTGSYFVHVHDKYGGESFISGKVVTISKQATDQEQAACRESR